MLYVTRNILTADTCPEMLDFLNAFGLNPAWIEINGRIRPRMIYRLYGRMKERVYMDIKIQMVSLRSFVEICKENSPVTDQEIKEWEKKNGALPKLPKDLAEELWAKIQERIKNNKL